MKSFTTKWMLAAAACAIAAGSAVAQGNNSYANMLDTIRTSNQALFRDMNAINQRNSDLARMVNGSGRTSSPAPEVATAPPPVYLLPQYPITATDFRSLPGRLMPDRLANGIAGVTFLQRLAIRGSYYRFLTDFEAENRRNNIAAAMAFAARLSLRAVYGRELSPVEVDQMAATFNNALATNPQFNAMAPQQKQGLYESLIITGGTVAVLQMQGIQQNDFVMQTQAKELGQMVLRQWLGI